MIWFDGSIKNAVDKVKMSGAVFLVFVQGEDSLSKKYETFLNEEIKFNSDDYVAIKIPYDSVALQQFKQIYVSVPVPSVFLIQNNGIPMNVISSELTSDLESAISNALNKQKTKLQRKNNSQSNEENKRSKEVDSKPSQRVKNIGHKLFDITEEDIKKRLNEIRAFPRFLLFDPPSFNDSLSASNLPPKYQSARIQFRLPDNNMPSWEFPDRSTLGDVRAYLTEQMKLSSDFKLLRTYPRTCFTPQDEYKTLTELSLAPSATLTVVPVEDKTVQAKVKNLIVRQGFVRTVLNVLSYLVFNFMNYFKKYVWKMPTTGEKPPERLPSDTALEKILNKKTSTSNIHGFKFEEDTDTDAEHPDNGNSTLQRFQ